MDVASFVELRDAILLMPTLFDLSVLLFECQGRIEIRSRSEMPSLNFACFLGTLTGEGVR